MAAETQRLLIPGYQIISQIYAGSKTIVYRAIRQQDQQPVIIKLLTSKYPNFQELLQFRNQYTISKNLHIPGIIQPLALETYGHGYILVMPDTGAIALREYIKYHRLSLVEFLRLAIQLSQILHNLHHNRVIHKDIKPANILIHPHSQQIELIDFSIASLLPKETLEIKSPNVLEGTLAYISPEQTGRMNRGIDYRSDFYSLGVTFYELLTGNLPFICDDPMELLHCHIAKPVHEIHNAAIPQVISDIVMKLMAKNAEDRYQSALGLKFDLEICLAQIQATDKVEYFEIAQRDRGDRFLIPEKLYGRETEVKTLLQAFERVANGSTEMMLVAGFSGIGKTAVVNEVHKPITRQQGYFIKGKFDQFNRNLPLSAFLQAFRDLIEQLLAESDTQLQTWKNQILLALGDNAQVMIAVIPELERIIGVQPPTTQLLGTAAQNRFNLLFQKFIQVFATSEHPLVIFIDDLQWADLASLNLIKLLMGESLTNYLLLIGAYRDHEVLAAHPLLLTLEDIRQTGAIVQTMTVQPLSQKSVNHLVADALHCTADIAQPLTELVYQKTQGNPFFTTQFLKVLHQDGLIIFNPLLRHWECDIVQVRQAALTDSVVEFMAQQLQKLPQQTQQMLKLGACIGNQFDLQTLAIVAENSATATAKHLWPALQERLILPTSETYKFFPTEEINQPEVKGAIAVQYRFLHDRIQQAAYSLIAEDEQQATHLHIGQLLLSNTSASRREERLFEIVNHLNMGSSLMTTPQEKTQLAQLNLTAGRKSKTATAYASAVDYFTTGIQLLPPDTWESNYDLTLAFYTEATDAAYLNTDFAQMEQLGSLVLQNARNLLDTIPVEQTRLMGIKAQGKLLEAIELGLQALNSLGVKFPSQPTQMDVKQAFATTQQLWQVPLHLLDLPPMTLPHRIAAMQILSWLVSCAYWSNHHLMALLIFKQVELSILDGNSPTSIYGYVDYGLILCGVLGDIPSGYDFGQLGWKLLEKLQAHTCKSRALYVIHTYIHHWKAPLQDSIPYLQEAYQIGLETGDIESAALNAAACCYYAYHAGQELTSLAAQTDAYRQSISQLKQTTSLYYLAIYQQVIYNLLGQTEVPQQLTGKIFASAELLPVLQANNHHTALFYWHINQVFLHYLFGEHQPAAQISMITEQYLEGGIGCFMVVLYSFYDALVQLALYENATKVQQQEILERVKQHQTKLETWATHAPFNHLHRCQLVAAEQYRILHQPLDAMEAYDLAIANAKDHHYFPDTALAYELAAKFYLDRGKEKVAAGYMQEAYYFYGRWGAKAKTKELEHRYPDLLYPILQQTTPTLNSLETLVSISGVNVTFHNATKTSSHPSINTFLDLTSILKASQSLSSTIQLDELLHQLTQIILQHSGGDRCVLILPNIHGEWQVQAIATLEGTELCSQPLEGNANLPMKLINYVKNTQKVVVIDELITDLPVIDDYLNERQPKSLLCLPIVSQGNLIGILYLKNRAVSGVFSRDRIMILNFLCTQAAISLENAQLHTQEQEKSQKLERALRELKQTQIQMIQSEKMASLGNLVAGVAHEVNNPIGFLNGSISNAKEYVQDLIGHIQLYQQNYPEPTTSIVKNSQNIDLEFVKEDLPQLLNAMRGATERIKSISKSLRTFSRADTDYKIRANIHEGIDSTLLILKYRLKADQHRPEIVIEQEYGDLPLIECFPGQLNQVFMNILANAIDVFDEAAQTSKFAELQNRPQKITIRTQAATDKIYIHIQDNGKGMSADVKNRIFDHLFTTKAVGKGTGLGLAIARQIVEEKHGGKIEVNSVLGEGTEFIIALPITG
ncbi:ATP-binding sensor histidine kinase [Nostoc sp. CMAA1605]|uniref:ATP-binding sensor histidine kinase n=1 Tax=Nostoc sp. CMAA1605 TaxID=2055159 RepID=UPI001F47B5F6|nr:ATP-binding sensor histidine kinase [Nostoc sp. CMAA1605]MCF4966112.1 serine/threonine protein kinase [Nostoc sp. CMAA1605]